MNDTRDPGPRRLYKNRRDKLVSGVCAGIADYFGFDVTITRLVVLVGLFFFLPTTLIAYVVLALLLPVKPLADRAYADERSEQLSRSVRSSPHATLDSIRHRFREIDGRLQRLEKYVTSKRYSLDREFEALED